MRGGVVRLLFLCVINLGKSRDKIATNTLWRNESGNTFGVQTNSGMHNQ